MKIGKQKNWKTIQAIIKVAHQWLDNDFI